MTHASHTRSAWTDLSRPVVMGILNVTPDSFSDGGAFVDPDAAVAHADRMIADGAAMVDVGPESTRPGAAPVAEAEQVRRSAPVIARVRERHPHVGLSIDTRSAVVARAALEAGADAVNDVSALRHDPDMAGVIAEHNAFVILMHMQGTPATMQENPTYTDVVAEVVAFLRDRSTLAVSAGIERGRILLDPGIGFGKTVDHNLQLLRGLPEIVGIGPPVLVGISRKAFIGKVLDLPNPRDRLAGSLACAVAAVLSGARVVRAHDVRETVEAVRVGACLLRP
jgi:dihydropteroate synthase